MTTVPVDARTLRNVLANYPTGVAVVTARDAAGETAAMVVGTFSSVSLDPPLVSFMPRKGSWTFGRIREADNFTVSVLAHDQVELCSLLAKSDPSAFTAFDWDTSALGNPAVSGALATIDCRLADILDAGDHHIVLGEAVELRAHRDTAPLIFFQGAYGGFAGLATAVDTVRLAEMVATASRASGELAALVRELDAEISLLGRIDDDFYTTAVRSAGDNQVLVGERYPIVPPLGEMFVAWDECDRARWLGMAGDEATRALLEQRLETARERKWAVSLRTEYRTANVVQALASYGEPMIAPALKRSIENTIKKADSYYRDETLVSEVDYAVEAVVTPIFGPGGAVDFVLRANLAGAQLSGRRVEECARVLMQAADSIAVTVGRGAYA